MAVQAVLFAVVVAAQSFGLLAPLERAFSDLGFRLLQRPATAGLVVVEMDAVSLARLPLWPWPRSYHATVIEQLLEAGATRVALDIDFSARSTPVEDAALARALGEAGPKVVLPVFVQLSRAPGGGHELLIRQPLAEFSASARAAANVRPDPDGLIRRLSTEQPWDQGFIPTVWAMLAGEAGNHPDFLIDYGIDLDTIPRLSYYDVLNGDFDPALVVGRQVLVGATAVELGDQFAAPLHRALAGPLVQALGYESLVQGRALMALATGPLLTIALFLVVAFSWAFRQLSWRRGLAALALSLLSIWGLSLAIQASAPVTIPIAPWLLAALLAFGGTTLTRIEEQDLRLLLQSLEMRRKDAFMAQVVENSFDGIITVDRQEGLRSLNQAAARILGVDADRALGKRLEALAPLPAGEADRAALAEAAFRPGGPHTVWVEGPNSRRIHLEAVVNFMQSDEREIAVVQFRDVTEQRLAERQAEEARNRLAAAVQATSEGFAVFDAEDRLLLANERFRELAGKVADEAHAGWPYRNLIRAMIENGRLDCGASDPEAWLAEHLAKASALGRSDEMCLSDGTHLRVASRRTLDGGQVRVFIDMTAIKAREDALETARAEAVAANRGKTEFLHTMSHELRTPLNAIIGFSETMSGELLGPLGTPKYKDYAVDIHGSAQHLLEIINDILDVARIETGRFTLTEESFAPLQLVEDCLPLIGERASAAGHDIAVRAEPGLPQLKADRRALRQVLLNLLSNAVKFTPQPSSIAVTVERRNAGLVFEVMDRGIGIRQEDIPRALAPFGQIESGLDRRYEGTGLGLALSSSLVELHGGRLELMSELGVGTRVAVWLPGERLEAGDPAGLRAAS
ncbi:MAG: CHASE2 domain-containing protein [Kiloniellales bacterium]